MNAKRSVRFLMSICAAAVFTWGCADQGGGTPGDTSSTSGSDATSTTLIGNDATSSTGTDAGTTSTGDTSGDAEEDTFVDLPDEDSDGIADDDEGRAESRDTDGDGTPDYLDTDSDGDGIPDSVEAGDANPGTAPYDSDGDGTPDFIDTDSDGNGIDDVVEGPGDLDGDGIYDAADTDNDGDFIPDEIEIVGEAADCDGDGTADPDGSAAMPRNCDGADAADYNTIDSDGDFISDAFEGRDVDTDGDGYLDRYESDTDSDGIPDSVEAGDMDLNTPPVDTDGDMIPDFRDPDSDNDGLSDLVENQSGTNPTNSDTDGDGVSDLIESAAGTNPNDSADNPQANGDFVFVVPYEAPPEPTSDDLDFSTDLKVVDVYVLVDRSGSMSSEIASIRDNIQTVANNVTCPPIGTGDPTNCIPDVYWGVGTVGYAGGSAYSNHLDVQPNPALISTNLPTNEPSGCCEEPLYLATWATMSGLGSASAGCSISADFGGRGSCSNGGVGYPCFRPGALPVVLLATDERPSTGDTYQCPGAADTIAAANAIGAKLIGVRGASGSGLTTDLAELAAGTGALDSAGNGLVVDGTDSAAASAIESGIRQLADGVRLDLAATPIDDASDGVDAVAEFVDRLETLQLGTAECANMLMDSDTNADTYPDAYVNVQTGTPVCWRLFAKQNNSVMPTSEPQLFRATIEVEGDGTTLLDTRDVYFLVPPEAAVIIPN